MSTSTFSSVFVTAADQLSAQAELGEGYFTAPLSFDGTEPATHYWSTGYWFDDELEFIVNRATWGAVVKFGDAQAALVDEGLMPITPAE